MVELPDPYSPSYQAVLDDIAEVLLPAEVIQARVRELGAQITADYAGLEPLIVFILKGALFFVADLVRAIHLPLQIDFMVVTSYGPSTETGGARIVTALKLDIHDRHVLLVEDIVDTGLTLRSVLDHLWLRRPASLRICALLNKPARRQVKLELAYVGFEIPDRFVVGYGLDYNECYRMLPFIGFLKPDRY